MLEQLNQRLAQDVPTATFVTFNRIFRKIDNSPGFIGCPKGTYSCLFDFPKHLEVFVTK